MDITLTTGVAAATPFMLALFTWLTTRRINSRAADRADFDSLIGPLQNTLDVLYNRVSVLEQRVGRAESDTRTLAQALRDALKYLETHYNDPGPDLPERARNLLEKN